MNTSAVVHKKPVWKKLLVLGQHDLKHIFRDQILTVLFLLPVFMIVLLVFGLPPLTRGFPAIVPYYSVITAVACMAAAITPSYVISFIMLDEKDESLFSALRVTPVSAFGFLAYRLSFVLLFGFIASLLTILFTQLIAISLFMTAGLSLLVALAAPLVTLCIVTYASNKIEGITFLKGINFVLMLPVNGFFAAPIWHIPLACIPVYWTYRAFDTTTSAPDFALFYTISLLVHAGLIVWLFRQFMKKIF